MSQLPLELFLRYSVVLRFSFNGYGFLRRKDQSGSGFIESWLGTTLIIRLPVVFLFVLQFMRMSFYKTLSCNSFHWTLLTFLQMDMRSQDVQLMKQLIAINTTISSMSSSRRPAFPVHRSASFSVINKAHPDTYQNRRCSDSACTTRKVLTRHNSEPVQTHSSSLNSSMEGELLFCVILIHKNQCTLFNQLTYQNIFLTNK